MYLSFALKIVFSNFLAPGLINGVAAVIPVWLTIILISPIGSVPVTSTPIVTHISILFRGLIVITRGFIFYFATP